MSSAGLDPTREELLRPEEREETSASTSTDPQPMWFSILVGPIGAAAAVAAHVLIGTTFFYNMGTDTEWTRCFEFATVTFLTIGFGDLVPTTVAAKLYFIFYIIFGLALQAAVVGTIINAIVDLRHTAPVPKETAPVEVHLRIWPHIKRLLWSITYLIGVTAGGAGLLHFAEHHNWIDSVYWAVATLTTVGYGDIAPTKYPILFGIYFLVGVLMFTYVLGQIVSIMLEVQRFRRLNRFFENGFTPEMLDRMDFLVDGQIEHNEFTQFILKELQYVDDATFARVDRLFRSLDVSGDGRLNLDDVRTQVSQLEFMVFMLQELRLCGHTEIDRILGIFHSLDINGDNILDLGDIRKVLDEDLQNHMDPAITVTKPANMVPELVHSDSDVVDGGAAHSASSGLGSIV